MGQWDNRTMELLTKHALFAFFAILTVGSAGIVAFSRNIVHSAFALLATFFGVAGLYVFLGADFLAGIQVLIYVGGILVLILFAVMLTHRIADVNLSNESTPGIVAGVVVALVLVGIVLVIFNVRWPLVPDWILEATERSNDSSTKSIGWHLLNEYLLPFEIVSVLLVAALVGAAFLARGERQQEVSRDTA